MTASWAAPACTAAPSFRCSRVSLRDPRHHGDAVIDNRRDRLTTILIAPLMTCFGAQSRLHADHLRLHSVETGLGLDQPAGARDVRPLRRRHRQRLGVSFLIKFFMLRDYRAGGPFMLELPTTRCRARAASRSASTTGEDVPAARRHTIFAMMS